MKAILYFCSLAAAFASTFTYATPQQALPAKTDSGYFSKQHPLSGSNLKAAVNSVSNGTMVAPTDIIINNASFNPIYVDVLEGGFTDVVGYRGYDHIFNGRGAYNTTVVLRDPNHYPFFTSTVCPRASITVYNYTPNDVVVDTESCRR